MKLGRRNFMALSGGAMLSGGVAFAEAPQKGVAWVEYLDSSDTPGLGFATVENSRISWEDGVGLARREDRARVVASTRFQAASLSKPIAAFTALKLVEQGYLGLDEPILRRLTSWKPTENLVGWSQITLRHLLTHSGGLNVPGFRGYARQEPIPTLLHILNGAGPANSDPIRIEHPLGTWFYSGGGYVVLQQLMNDVTGKPFADVVRTNVFDPLRMKNSSFLQPEPHEDVAWGHNSHGALEGLWHRYPEQAAAGLWTTPGDLARFAAALMPGAGNKSMHKTAESMLTTQPGLTANGQAFGLGIFLKRGTVRCCYHLGGNEGYRCLMIAWPDAGRAVVVMTNGDGGLAPAKDMARALAAARKWPERDFRGI